MKATVTTPNTAPAEAPAAERATESAALRKVHPHRVNAIGRTIAIQIDREAVQMAVSQQFGPRRRLIDLRKEYLPSSALHKGSAEDLIISSITDFISTYATRKTRYVLCLQGQETASRSFVLPALKTNELRSAVEFEARRQLPFPANDCYYDYRILARLQRNGRPHVKVTLQAATRKMVDERLELLKRLDITVSHVYLAQDAIGQLLSDLEGFHDEAHYALLDVGLERSEISYYQGRSLEYSHSSSFGSSFLSGIADGSWTEYFAESLAGEIQNSLDFYAGQYSTNFHNRVYVYGNLAFSDELYDQIGDRFGFEFARFPVDLLRRSYRFNDVLMEPLPVCLSTVAAAVCNARLANLLPQDERKRVELQNRTRVTGWVSAAVVGVVLLAALGGEMSNRAAETQRQALDMQVTAFRQSDAYSIYDQLRHQIASDQRYLDHVKPAPTYLSLNLKELSHLVPDDVSLTTLDYNPSAQGANFFLGGYAESSDRPPELPLAEFVARLEASQFYEAVSVTRHVKRSTTGGFRIDFQLSMRGVV